MITLHSFLRFSHYLAKFSGNNGSSSNSITKLLVFIVVATACQSCQQLQQRTNVFCFASVWTGLCWLRLVTASVQQLTLQLTIFAPHTFLQSHNKHKYMFDNVFLFLQNRLWVCFEVAAALMLQLTLRLTSKHQCCCYFAKYCWVTCWLHYRIFSTSSLRVTPALFHQCFYFYMCFFVENFIWVFISCVCS